MRTKDSAGRRHGSLASFATAFLLTGLTATGQPAITIPTNGLVAFYPFNGNLNDASGNGNNGSFVGSDWTFSLDRFGQPTNSLFLNTLATPPANSTGSYVTASASPLLDFNANFTLSVWLNIPDGLGGYWVHNLISDGTDATSANFRLISNVDSEGDTGGYDYLQFVGNLSGATKDIHAFVPQVRNTWWQAVVVRSGNNVSLFTNGVLAVSAPWTGTMVNYPVIELGSMEVNGGNLYPSYYPLVGGIDDVAIYNRALSSNEVSQLFQIAPRLLDQPANKVGYWGFPLSLSVAAQGTAPLSYRWFDDGFPIPWGTNATLTFTNLDLTDAGEYSVQVTNLFGSVTSSPAALIVNPAGVSLGLYPGLTISGAVGKDFGIQYTTNLVITNWTTITTLTLTQPMQLWVDTNANVSAGNNPQRFYRVVAIP